MKVHVSSEPVMTVERGILKESKLVYLLTVLKGVKYGNGRSKIVYVGMTKSGVSRIAVSAAYRSDVLNEHGIRRLDVHIVSSSAKRGAKNWWTHLEHALLAGFRARYFQLPRLNKQGQKLRYTEALEKRFKHKAIDKILDKFEPLH